MDYCDWQIVYEHPSMYVLPSGENNVKLAFPPFTIFLFFHSENISWYDRQHGYHAIYTFIYLPSVSHSMLKATSCTAMPSAAYSNSFAFASHSWGR